jgi:hypothetical protein
MGNSHLEKSPRERRSWVLSAQKSSAVGICGTARSSHCPLRTNHSAARVGAWGLHPWLLTIAALRLGRRADGRASDSRRPDAGRGARGVSPRWGLGWMRGHPLLGLTPQAIDDRRFAAGGRRAGAGPADLPWSWRWTQRLGECRPVGAWDGCGGILSWGLRPRLLTIAALRLGREHSHAHRGGPSVGVAPGEFRPLGARNGYGDILSWGLRPRLLAGAPLGLGSVV